MNRPEPREGRTRQGNVQLLGENPTPIDVLPEPISGRLGADAIKGSPNATVLLRKYADDIAKGAPAVARRAADKIAPEDARTGQEAAQEAAQEAQAAQESVRPDVPLGDASRPSPSVCWPSAPPSTRRPTSCMKRPRPRASRRSSAGGPKRTRTRAGAR